jgi:hypothetical protein
MNVIEGDIRAVVGNSSEEIEVLVLAVLGVLHRATADSSLRIHTNSAGAHPSRAHPPINIVPVVPG